MSRGVRRSGASVMGHSGHSSSWDATRARSHDHAAQFGGVAQVQPHLKALSKSVVATTATPPPMNAGTSQGYWRRGRVLLGVVGASFAPGRTSSYCAGGMDTFLCPAPTACLAWIPHCYQAVITRPVMLCCTQPGRAYCARGDRRGEQPLLRTRERNRQRHGQVAFLADESS